MKEVVNIFRKTVFRRNGEKVPDGTARNTFSIGRAELGYLLFCFLMYFGWSIVKTLNYAPDEAMRYLIPEYIFRTGRLPDGWNSDLRNELWGFSYAFYPTFLGPLLSAGCMKIASLFTENISALVAAARFPSVVCATGTVFLSFGIGKRMFGKRGAWIYAVCLSVIPQFVFLASYVNNDMICIFGSALVLSAWVSAFMDGWDIRNGLILAAGIIVVALSYYNGYGWILCSVLLFAGTWIRQPDGCAGRNRMTGIGLMICLTVLAATGYFFIRNAVLYDGDFLGMRTLSESARMYAAPEWKPGTRETPLSAGMSVTEMFVSRAWTGTPWIAKLFVTFVGAFGFADVFLPLWIYGIYGALFAAMAAGCVGALIEWSKTRKNVPKEEKRKTLLLYGMLVLAFLIPPVLCVYYSYAVDYQPQGRYCYPMILVFFWFGTQGLLWLLERWNVSERSRNRAVAAGCIMLVFLTLYITATVYFDS